MVVVSYVSDNICRICQMDKMNCISNNHTIKNNGMQFVCEEDWKKSVKYVVKYSCLCECMRFRESVRYNQDMETKKRF